MAVEEPNKPDLEIVGGQAECFRVETDTFRLSQPNHQDFPVCLEISNSILKNNSTLKIILPLKVSPLKVEIFLSVLPLLLFFFFSLEQNF